METTPLNENNIFSWERFVTLMKADYVVNKSNYIKIIIAACGFFIALAILISIIAIIDINSFKHSGFDSIIKSKQDSFGSTYLVISIWIFNIGLTILGSLTFNNLSSKRKRISAFMIPASRVEKFSLRFLEYIVVGTITLILGFLIGALICEIGFGGGSPIVEDIREFIDSYHSCTIISAFALWAFLGCSLYALGSSLWPKLSWVKTWVALLILEWIGAIFMIFISAADLSWFTFFQFWDHHITLLKWTGLTSLALINIVCWIFAWLRYRNTQIIQRFMTK